MASGEEDSEWNALVRSIEGDVDSFVDDFILEFFARSPYGVLRLMKKTYGKPRTLSLPL